MSAWRRVAIEKIPGYRKLIEQASNPMQLWTDLRWPFVRAHEAPHNEEFIGQVYDYAAWCLASNDPNTFTAVVVAFYEDLPRYPEVRSHVAKWLPTEVFSGLEEVFRYHLSDKEHAEFVREFYERRDQIRRCQKKLTI
jgi:hypothetical protein